MENNEHTPAEPKSNKGMAIVGINLVVLAVYTLIFKFNDGGVVGDAFFLLLHVVVCIIAALADRNWMWILAGVLVLVIGVSTCATFTPFNMH